MQSRNRAIGLDLLRISLVILTFLFHSYVHILQCDYGLLNNFIIMGATSMTGFFLLSGYVMNLSHGRSDMSDIKEIKRFYIKRLISIMPLYYAWALLHVILNIVENGSTAIYEEVMLFPIETLGIQSTFASLFDYSHNGGSWFISCILMCYAVYPLLQIISKQMTDKTRFIIITILCGILLWSPIVQFFFKLQTLYSNPFFRILEFTIGILISQININKQKCYPLFRFLRKYTVSIFTVIIYVAGLGIASRMGIPKDYMLYSWVALPCYISLLVSMGYHDFPILQGSKTIKYLCDISYCLFLGQLVIVWHGVKLFMEHIGCDSNILKIFLSASIVFIIANVFHFCIEKPSSRYLMKRM